MGLRHAVLCLSVLALSAYAVDESAVTVIAGKADFDAALASADLVMVEFYAPWCGHCKELTPKYAEAAATLAKGDASIKMAKLDATDEVNAELAQQFKIKGFPTLKVFRKADTAAPVDYQGARTAEGLVAWLTEVRSP
jgi:protein disulfide-isomerase A1